MLSLFKFVLYFYYLLWKYGEIFVMENAMQTFNREGEGEALNM